MREDLEKLIEGYFTEKGYPMAKVTLDISAKMRPSTVIDIYAMIGIKAKKPWKHSKRS